MLSSIHPLGERARGNRWGVTTAAYMAGTTLGGAATGAGFGTIGWLVFDAWGPSPVALTWTVALLAAMAFLWDLSGRGLPSPHRQVNEHWLTRYRGWVYGFGFGLQLGTGLVTYVVTASLYLTWMLATLTGSPLAGALVGAGFGLVRSAALLTVGRVTTPVRLRAYFAAMARWDRRAHLAAAAGPLLALITVIAVGDLR